MNTVIMQMRWCSLLWKTLIWSAWKFSWPLFGAQIDFHVRSTGVCVKHRSYLSRRTRPAVVYFFQASALFSIANAKLWPVLAIFGYLLTFWSPFTSLNSVVVPQNWQIWGMVWKILFFFKRPKDLTEAQLIPAQLVKREGWPVLDRDD